MCCLFTESESRPLDDQSTECRRDRGGVQMLPVSCRSLVLGDTD